jgi:hypothetical protein
MLELPTPGIYCHETKPPVIIFGQPAGFKPSRKLGISAQTDKSD